MKYLANVVTLDYDPERCAGCGRCVEVCPRGVFAMQDGRAVITDRDLCMECGACTRNCNFGAISVGAGVGCAQAVIAGMLTGREECACSSQASDCC